MSSERPTIRLTRPLGAVRTGAASAPAPQRSAADAAELQELRRRLAEQQQRAARAEAELARLSEREQTFDGQMARLAELLAAVERERADLLQANEEEIVSFSLSITEKVLQYEIENGRYKIGEVVAATLRAVRDRGAVVVRVNPVDLELTQQALQSMGQGDGGRISAVADAAVSPASCCIETDSGRIFSDVPERLKRIEQSLLKRNGEPHGV